MFDDAQRAWQAAHVVTGDQCALPRCEIYRKFTERVLAAHRIAHGPSAVSVWCTCGVLARSCGVRATARLLMLDDPPEPPDAPSRG